MRNLSGEKNPIWEAIHKEQDEKFMTDIDKHIMDNYKNHPVHKELDKELDKVFIKTVNSILKREEV
jgi:hypothetical protein